MSGMPSFDPRVTPARADVAAKALEGKIKAARYVEGRLYEVIAPQAPLRREPTHEMPLATEALKGERLTIYDSNGEGWAWGQLESDGCVGWLPQEALALAGPSPTHKVAALRTFVFPGPSIKMSPAEALPFGARLAVARVEGRFAVTPAGGYVPAVHLVSIGTDETDFVAVAERFLGTPYLWGGKTTLGIDCSGLVQIALAAAGIPCPRDSDMQENFLPAPMAAAADLADLKRGDLVFWKGHVAVVRQQGSFVHANAFHMSVAIEPITEAVARIGAAGSEITSVRLLSRVCR